MDPEDEFIMLSALQHFLYCPRQCYLIHAEQLWADNYFTASGTLMHDRADSGETAFLPDGVRLVRSLPIRSVALGVSGRADVVEFDGRTGRVFPVEFKLGKPKLNSCDRVQLCAQAICLEEMLGVEVPEGAVYYGRTHRRLPVAFSPGLREETAECARAVHVLLEQERRPAPPPDTARCRSCSICDLCMPDTADPAQYLEQLEEECP
ncbi:MAG: CRISPR-associated protein Cas4 [Lentisphaeria bacterium]|nr:CRISPR-associated protein Cas4 [Lentisphaeria bacterium]